MVPLVLCFKTMWSVPDTVSWGADYESRTDSSMLVLPHNSADIHSYKVAVNVKWCADQTYD